MRCCNNNTICISDNRYGGQLATQTLFMIHTKDSKSHSWEREYADLSNITRPAGISEHGIIILVYYCWYL